MHEHGTIKRVRKRRKHARKLSDNRELMMSVIVMVISGVLLTGAAVYLLSTRSCAAPKFLQRVEASPATPPTGEAVLGTAVEGGQ
jgi:hypothetical protein